MTRYSVPILYDEYIVSATDVYDQSVEDTFVYLANKYGVEYADRWLGQIQNFIYDLERPKSLGVTDPIHFSDTYAHRQVPGTQTTVFFLVEEERIYMVTSGFSGRNWPRVLADMAREIQSQIAMLKRK